MAVINLSFTDKLNQSDHKECKTQPVTCHSFTKCINVKQSLIVRKKELDNIFCFTKTLKSQIK